LRFPTCFNLRANCPRMHDFDVHPAPTRSIAYPLDQTCGGCVTSDCHTACYRNSHFLHAFSITAWHVYSVPCTQTVCLCMSIARVWPRQTRTASHLSRSRLGVELTSLPCSRHRPKSARNSQKRLRPPKSENRVVRETEARYG
jgi:hypothetical protein